MNIKTSLRLTGTLLFSFIFILSACSDDASNSTTNRDPGAAASYKLTYATEWTAATFPTNFPAGAHFSGLIGGTHNDQVKFWENGQLASDGIENMAETGAKGSLTSEIEAAKADGKAQFLLSGSGATASDTVELEFDINPAYPLVTLVSMVAPSPDWFVGVRDLSLFDSAVDDWKQTVVVKLAVYDAGSDSGLVFGAGNADTQPPEVITRLSSSTSDTDFVDGVGPAGEFVATMTFERIK